MPSPTLPCPRPPWFLIDIDDLIRAGEEQVIEERTFKLSSGTTFGYGRYLKFLHRAGHGA
jgi:hypothetical protein